MIEFLASLPQDACTDIWCRLGQFINGAFLSALFGALAGSLATYFGTRRLDDDKALRGELAGTNAAISIAATIGGVGLQLKSQHVQRIVRGYERQFLAYSLAQRLQRFAPPGQKYLFEFIADFRDIQPPIIIADELRRTIMDKVPTATDAMAIVAALVQSSHALARAIKRRSADIQNKRLHQPKTRDQAGQDDLTSWWFGLRDRAGHIDESYPDSLLAIASYTDDVIYFSMLLCDVLHLHGRRLAKRIGGTVRVSKWVWSPEKLAPLLPDKNNYPDYERQYRGPRLRLRDKSRSYRIKLCLRRYIVLPYSRTLMRFPF